MTNQQKTSHISSIAGVRHTITSKYVTVIEEVRPIFVPLTFSD